MKFVVKPSKKKKLPPPIQIRLADDMIEKLKNMRPVDLTPQKKIKAILEHVLETDAVIEIKAG